MTAVLAFTHEPVDLLVAALITVALAAWVWVDHRRPRP